MEMTFKPRASGAYPLNVSQHSLRKRMGEPESLSGRVGEQNISLFSAT